MLMLFSTTLFADINVKSFRMLENDLDARVHHPLIDQNNDVCAIIKVVTTETGFSFDGGTLGIIKTVNKPAEIWVYVSWGLQRLTIAHPQLGLLRNYMFPMPIEKATVYEMVLVTGKVVVTVEKEEIESQWLVIRPTPANASVYIDDAYINKGIYQAKLKPGSYTYRVEAPMYHTTVGKIQITDKKEELNITLKPNFGYIKISSTPESDAQVLIDDKPLSQHTPVRSNTLKSGEYTVKVIKELYQPFAQKVMVEDEKTTEINAILQPNYGELNIYAPEASTIYLNNIEKGKGSWTGRLSAGIYSLEARLASHQTAKEDVEIKVGDNKIVNLHPKPIYGSVDIMTNPPGANIIIDGKDYGTTPNTISKLLIGSYELEINMDGYFPIKQHITIREESEVVINEELNNSYVNITSMPSDADVLVQNKKIGTTPYTLIMKKDEELVKIKKKGFKTYSTLLNTSQEDVFIDLSSYKKMEFKDCCNFGIIAHPLPINLFSLKQTQTVTSVCDLGVSLDIYLCKKFLIRNEFVPGFGFSPDYEAVNWYFFVKQKHYASFLFNNDLLLEMGVGQNYCTNYKDWFLGKYVSIGLGWYDKTFGSLGARFNFGVDKNYMFGLEVYTIFFTKKR